MALKKKDYLVPNPQSLPAGQAGPIPKALVLLSGGLDSSTVLAIAKAEGHELYAVSFDYNQRHSRELESAKLVADSLNVRKHLIVKFDLREIGGSALTSEMEVPKAGIRDQGLGISKEINSLTPKPPSPTPIPVTYVPARNTIFLSFALGWAEVLKAENIFIGANAIDYSGYPDCRPEYLKAFEEMANLATKASVEGKMRFAIRAPLVSMTKAEIIKKGTELGLDYSLTWSCYDPQPKKGLGIRGQGLVRAKSKGQEVSIKHQSLIPDPQSRYVPCRQCDSCRLREKGFKEAGVKDPLLKDWI